MKDGEELKMDWKIAQNIPVILKIIYEFEGQKWNESAIALEDLPYSLPVWMVLH